jgi:hypothetical protein
MQDRYTGDIGDFGKCSLLRNLTRDDLRLGVIWYLNESKKRMLMEDSCNTFVL